MEYIPHNFLCQSGNVNPLSRNVIHRTVNRLLEVGDEFQERLDGLKFLTCSEPFIWCPGIEEYGRNISHSGRLLHRLKKEISYKNEVKACQAICTLSELIHHPEMAVQAIEMNIVQRLVKPLKSNNIILLQRCLLCIKHLCMLPIGVASLVKNKYIIKNVRECIRHKSAIIRCQTSHTVNALVHNYFAVHALSEAGYLKAIMKCVYEAKDFNLKDPVCFHSITEMKDLLIFHLDSLVRLIDESGAAKVALISAGVFELAPFLHGSCIHLKKAVASLFVELAKHPIGKKGIVAHGLIPILCNEVANNTDMELKTKAAAILQFATIDSEGRKQALKCNLINILVKFLPIFNVPLNLKKYALTNLTNLAELPEGRALLRTLQQKTKLTVLLGSNDEDLIRSVKQLYRVINWEP